MGRCKPTRFLCERKLGRKVSDESPARSKSLLFVAGSLTTGPYARSAPFARKRKGYHQPAARGFICSSGPHKVSILMTLLARRFIPPTGPRHLRVRSWQLNLSRIRRATIAPDRAANPSRAFNLFDSDCQGISLRIGGAIHYSCPARLAALSLRPGVPEKERTCDEKEDR